MRKTVNYLTSYKTNVCYYQIITYQVTINYNNPKKFLNLMYLAL